MIGQITPVLTSGVLVGGIAVTRSAHRLVVSRHTLRGRRYATNRRCNNRDSHCYRHWHTLHVHKRIKAVLQCGQAGGTRARNIIATVLGAR